MLPLELGDLPYPGENTDRGSNRSEWFAKTGPQGVGTEVTDIVTKLKLAFVADYIVLGGGNAKQMKELPMDVELGHNRNAYPGGADFGKSIRARASQSGK